MPSVDLSENEWTQVIALMSYAPARECMALINKIGNQIATHNLREREKNERAAMPPAQQGNGQEAHHE